MDNETDYKRKQLEIEEEQLEISKENLKFKKTDSSSSKTISITSLVFSIIAVLTSVIMPICLQNRQMSVDITQNCKENAEKYYINYIQNSNFFSIVESLSGNERIESDDNFSQNFCGSLNNYLVYGNNIDSYNISDTEKENIKDMHRSEIIQLLGKIEDNYGREELRPSIDNIKKMVAELYSIFR